MLSARFARFNVFQLVRLLRHRQGEPWPIGQRLRFRADLSAAFAGREVTRLARAPGMPRFRAQLQNETTPRDRIEVRTPNYCLASELGPLPEPFLEWVRDQERAGARGMGAFFDLFNQRIHVLRHELKLNSLRALDPAPPADTRYAHQLAALMGLGLPAQQQQMPLPARAWLGLAGLLANERKSAVVIERVMSAYLGAPTRVETLLGSWRPLADGDRMALGRAGHMLGRTSLLGQRTWDARAAVRLSLTLPYAVCAALLPRPGKTRQAGYQGLVAMIRLLLDRRFDCEIQLGVAPASVPRLPLSRTARATASGPRLGQTAWLGGRPRASTQPTRFRIAAYDEVPTP